MTRTYLWGLGLAITVSLSSAAFAQDNVTIPKSRLEELERKEAELEKLKTKPAAPVHKPEKPSERPSIPASTVAPAKPGLAVSALPPFVEGQKIEATELAAYFRQDPDAAKDHFKSRKMAVQGEVLSFEPAMFKRTYRVLLQGDDRATRVSCEMSYPPGYSAVFTVEEGSRLVGLHGETRYPIARIGDRVLVTGVCKGLRGQVVIVQGKQMEKVP